MDEKKDKKETETAEEKTSPKKAKEATEEVEAGEGEHKASLPGKIATGAAITGVAIGGLAVAGAAGLRHAATKNFTNPIAEAVGRFFYGAGGAPRELPPLPDGMDGTGKTHNDRDRGGFGFGR